MAVPTKERRSTTGYKVTIVILVIIILGLLAMIMSGFLQSGNQSQAEQNVADLYGLITGTDVEVIKTSEENGLFKVTVRYTDVTGRDTLQDVFVTPDGMFLTDRLVDIDDQKTQLTSQNEFAQCLFDAQIRIFGLANDPSTQAQLQVLGAFSNRLYFDCGGQNLAVCQQLNITQVPVIFVNNQLVQGPQNAEWFEQISGCSLAQEA